MNDPVLICEAGLHGDGNADYYLQMITTLRTQWTGWPKLAFKMQHWVTPASPWATKIREATGRAPLASVNDEASLAEISETCGEAGFIFMSTPHDTEAVRLIQQYVDWFKLGSFDATQPGLVAAVAETELPTVISTGLLTSNALGTVLAQWPAAQPPRQLSGISAYPANAPWYGVGGMHGYSCHSVPSLIPTHVLDAAGHCSTIEVHVTTRARSARPLPGDMCVSLDVFDFAHLATQVGEIWRQQV